MDSKSHADSRRHKHNLTIGPASGTSTRRGHLSRRKPGLRPVEKHDIRYYPATLSAQSRSTDATIGHAITDSLVRQEVIVGGPFYYPLNLPITATGW